MGVTAMHEGEGGCLNIVDEEKCGINDDIENIPLLSGTDLGKYSSNLSPLN